MLRRAESDARGPRPQTLAAPDARWPRRSRAQTLAAPDARGPRRSGRPRNQTLVGANRLRPSGWDGGSDALGGCGQVPELRRRNARGREQAGVVLLFPDDHDATVAPDRGVGLTGPVQAAERRCGHDRICDLLAVCRVVDGKDGAVANLVVPYADGAPSALAPPV